MIYFGKALASIAIWLGFSVCAFFMHDSPVAICFIALCAAIATASVWEAGGYVQNDGPEDDDDWRDGGDDDSPAPEPDPFGKDLSDDEIDKMGDDKFEDNEGGDWKSEPEKSGKNRIDKYSLN